MPGFRQDMGYFLQTMFTRLSVCLTAALGGSGVGFGFFFEILQAVQVTSKSGVQLPGQIRGL